MYGGFAEINDKIMFTAIEAPTDMISEVADYAAIGFILSGNLPAAAYAEKIGKIADGVNLGAKALRAIITGKDTDIQVALGKAAEIWAEIIVGTIVKKGMAEIKIIIGKNGHYYMKGVRGSITNKKGLLTLLMKKLAPNVSEKVTEKIVEGVTDELNKCSNN